MQNTSEVSAALREIAALLEFSRAPKFKVRAYQRAVEVVDAVADLAPLVEQGRLKELEGIGQTLSGQIEGEQRGQRAFLSAVERFTALVRPNQAG